MKILQLSTVWWPALLCKVIPSAMQTWMKKGSQDHILNWRALTLCTQWWMRKGESVFFRVKPPKSVPSLNHHFQTYICIIIIEMDKLTCIWEEAIRHWRNTWVRGPNRNDINIVDMKLKKKWFIHLKCF